MFGKQLTFPIVCPLNTCVTVIPSQATCHSLTILWFSDAPLYFASSVLLSCISLYFHLYLLTPPKPLCFNSDAFSFNEILPDLPSQIYEINCLFLSTLCVLLFLHSLHSALCCRWLCPLVSPLTVRVYKARYVSDSFSSPMEIRHTHI